MIIGSSVVADLEKNRLAYFSVKDTKALYERLRTYLGALSVLSQDDGWQLDIDKTFLRLHIKNRKRFH